MNIDLRHRMNVNVPSAVDFWAMSDGTLWRRAFRSLDLSHLSQTGLYLLSQRLLWIYSSIICSCFCSLCSNAWAPACGVMWSFAICLCLWWLGCTCLALGWNVSRAPFAPSLDYRSSESSLAVHVQTDSNCPDPPNQTIHVGIPLDLHVASLE